LACVSGLLLSGVRSGGARQAARPGCEGCARQAYVGDADAGATGVALRESLSSRLAELLTSPCFHLVRSDASEWGRDIAGFGSGARPPEYVFTGRYEENLNTKDGDGGTVMSRLTIGLFYDGEAREPVAAWSVTSPVNSYTSCTNRMFKNEDAVLRAAGPMEALLRDFERRPVACDVHPAKKDLACGETTDLILAAFRDERSREPKPFNRIVVEAEKGEILGGEAVEGRPKARAFLVGDGLVELRYRAPSRETAGVEDIVAVYGSCDIVRPDRQPLSRTAAGRKIGEVRLTVHCGAAPGTIVYRRTISWDDTVSNRAGSVAYKGSLTEEATVRVSLKYTNSYKDKDYYRSESAAATYSYSYSNDAFINGRKADALCEKVEDSGAFGPEDSVSVRLVVDRKSGGYQLEIGLRGPEKREGGAWAIAVETLPDLLGGTAGGGGIRGSYAAPAGERAGWPGHRSNQGNDPGTSFSWNLELPERK